MKKMTGMGPTKMGAVKTSSKPDGVIKKGATKGKMVKMAEGGMPTTKKPMSGGLPPLPMSGGLPPLKEKLKEKLKDRRPGEGLLQEKLRSVIPSARKGGMVYGGKVKMRGGGKAC